MQSRYSMWLTSLSASLALRLGPRLNTLGEIIANQLERSYAGVTGDLNWPAKRTPTRAGVSPTRASKQISQDEKE